jgi:DNA-binding MarR family transcriptional regulator
VTCEDQLRVPTADRRSKDAPAEAIRLQINLRLLLDEVADAEAEALRLDACRQPDQHELRRLASSIYNARRGRDHMGVSELSGEPAWDMLLALYCLPRRGWLMTAAALRDAVEVPQTAALGWQNMLTEEGLIERGPRGVDARNQIFRLTPAGRTLLERYLSRLFDFGASALRNANLRAD